MLELFTLYHESKQLVVCEGGTHALSSEWKRRTPNASAFVIMAQNSPGRSLGIYEQPPFPWGHVLFLVSAYTCVHQIVLADEWFLFLHLQLSDFSPESLTSQESFLSQEMCGQVAIYYLSSPRLHLT